MARRLAPMEKAVTKTATVIELEISLAFMIFLVLLVNPLTQM
jgi:hypothetical protein